MCGIRKRNEIIFNANLLVVVLDRLKGLTSNICSLLKSTGFFEKFIYHNDEHKICFIDLEEKEQSQSPISGKKQQASTRLERRTTSIHSAYYFLHSVIVNLNIFF